MKNKIISLSFYLLVISAKAQHYKINNAMDYYHPNITTSYSKKQFYNEHLGLKKITTKYCYTTRGNIESNDNIVTAFLSKNKDTIKYSPYYFEEFYNSFGFILSRKNYYLDTLISSEEYRILNDSVIIRDIFLSKKEFKESRRLLKLYYEDEYRKMEILLNPNQSEDRIQIPEWFKFSLETCYRNDKLFYMKRIYKGKTLSVDFYQHMNIFINPKIDSSKVNNLLKVKYETTQQVYFNEFRNNTLITSTYYDKDIEKGKLNFSSISKYFYCSTNKLRSCLTFSDSAMTQYVSDISYTYWPNGCLKKEINKGIHDCNSDYSELTEYDSLGRKVFESYPYVVITTEYLNNSTNLIMETIERLGAKPLRITKYFYEFW